MFAIRSLPAPEALSEWDPEEIAAEIMKIYILPRALLRLRRKSRQFKSSTNQSRIFFSKKMG
jgi:hypothetical protein